MLLLQKEIKTSVSLSIGDNWTLQAIPAEAPQAKISVSQHFVKRMGHFEDKS